MSAISSIGDTSGAVATGGFADLIQATMVFPEDATVRFNLACYQAQLGHLDPARGRLKEAIALDPRFRKFALADPDLSPLHDGLRSARS